MELSGFSRVFNVLNFNLEFAVVIAGLTASALLGLIYSAPIVLALKYTLLRHRKIRHKSKDSHAFAHDLSGIIVFS